MARTSNARGRGRGRGRAVVQASPNSKSLNHDTPNTQTPICPTNSNDSNPSQPLTTTPTNHIPFYKGPMGSDAPHGIGKQLRLDSGGNLQQLSPSASTERPNQTSIPSQPNPKSTATEPPANPSQPIGGKGRCRITVPENHSRFFPSIKIPGVGRSTGIQGASAGGGQNEPLARGRGGITKPIGQGRGSTTVRAVGEQPGPSVVPRGQQTLIMGQGRGGPTLAFGRGKGIGRGIPMSQVESGQSGQMGIGRGIPRVGSPSVEGRRVTNGSVYGRTSEGIGGRASAGVEGERVRNDGVYGIQSEGRGGRPTDRSGGRTTTSGEGSGSPMAERRNNLSGEHRQRVSSEEVTRRMVEGSGSHNEYPETGTQEARENSFQNQETDIPEANDMEQVPNESGVRESQESETSTRTKPKLYIWMENGRTILPSEEASAVISETFTRRLDMTGYNWKGVTKKTKDIYFQEFLKDVEYDPSIEHALYKPWHSKAGIRYKDFISKHKTKQERYMSNALWARWNQYWQTQEFKDKSLLGKKNRLGKDENPSKHTAGSITFRKHWERMNVAAKRTVSAPEMYISTHKRKETEEYITEKAQSYGVALETRMQQIEPNLSEEEALRKKNEMYLEVVGPPRKGRWYGTDPVILGEVTGSSTGHSQAGSYETQDELRMRLEEVEARERENAQEVLRLKKLNSTLRSKLPGYIRQMVNKAIQSTYDAGEADAEMNADGDEADNELDKAFDDMMIDEEPGDDADANHEDNAGDEAVSDWERENVENL